MFYCKHMGKVVLPNTNLQIPNSKSANTQSIFTFNGFKMPNSAQNFSGEIICFQWHKKI